MSSEIVILTSVYSPPVPPCSCLKPLNIVLGIEQINSVVSKNEYVFHHAMYNSSLVLSYYFLLPVFRISTQISL